MDINQPMAIALGATQDFSSLLQSIVRGVSHRMLGSWSPFPVMKVLLLCFNSRVRQVISYVPPPDPSVLQSSPPSTTISLPYEFPANLPWAEQKLPSVVVRGVMFRRVHVEVECKVSHRAESCRLYDLGLLPFSSSHLYVIFCHRATPSLTCVVPLDLISSKRRHTTTPCPHK